MSNGAAQDEEAAVSARRVRRGCYATVLILIAMTAMLVTASQGNLFFLLLLVPALAVLLFARFVVR